MSASLVGSEMCIRDRAMGDRSASTRQTAGDASVARALGTTADTFGVPVSYTHLTLPTICSV
eukprot:14456134-Alexandrium_andersonii.AAC.1